MDEIDADLPNQDDFRFEEIERMKHEVELEIAKRRKLESKKASNTLEWLETSFFIIVGITVAGVGAGTNIVSSPIAALCGALGLTGKLILPKLRRKVKKHHGGIVESAEFKLARINNLISKSITNGEISASEFSLIVNEFLKKSKVSS